LVGYFSETKKTNQKNRPPEIEGDTSPWLQLPKRLIQITMKTSGSIGLFFNHAAMLEAPEIGARATYIRERTKE
jgi:hypothetical protein